MTSEPVAAFFWSPDASRLAVLTAVGDGLVRWLVVEGSDTLRLPAFRPTRRWAGSVVQFFEQYAHSHSHWSGDGTKLVAPAVDEHGRAGALIQPVHSPGDDMWVPDAELAWWA